MISPEPGEERVEVLDDLVGCLLGHDVPEEAPGDLGGEEPHPLGGLGAPAPRRVAAERELYPDGGYWLVTPQRCGVTSQ